MIGLDSWIFLEYYSSGPKRDKCEKIIFCDKKKAISAILLMEVIYKSARKLGKIKTREIVRDITCSASTILVNVDRNIAEEAANLRLKYYKGVDRELSYADCIGYIYARKHNLRFLTGDKEFKTLENVEFISA